MSDEKSKSTPQQETRSALQRLILVLAFTIGILIYSYGWTVTEIDLGTPQEERRQDNVTRALRELLSPRVFDQEREVLRYSAPFLMDCSTGEAPPQSDPAMGEPVVVIEPACADANDTITVQVSNVLAGADARLRWLPPSEDDEDVRERPLEIIELERENLVIDTSGGFTGTIEIPRIRGGEGQIHTLDVLVAIPSGPIVFSETALLVIDRMIQTIFMALVATTVAIPIAALISFFAAQNLMKRIRLSVGSMLMAFILFSVGIWAGMRYLSPLGELGVRIGRGELFAPIGALMAFVIPIALIAITIWSLSQMTRVQDTGAKRDTRGILQQTLSPIIITLVLIFVIGVVGGLGMLGGEQISLLGDSLLPDQAAGFGGVSMSIFATLIAAFGNLLSLLGNLVELFIAPITGAMIGFTLASIAASVLGNGIRRIRGAISHVLAGIMGAVSGAILLGFLATVALWAALLGILPPLIAAIIGGQILRQILGRFMYSKPAIGIRIKTPTQRTAEWVVFAVGFVGVFLYVFDALTIGRSLVDGTLPPQTMATFLGMNLPLTVYVFNASIIGTVLGGIASAIAGLQGVFPLGNMLYNTSRTSLNIVRSIEPLIMGLVFVIWVGIGPFAGVLALTLHSIASLGKLYSEQIENIDPGPIEALESTGANQLQTIIYAVVPQIIPPYIAFTIYRWDINVRMSTIIGFVGGGGIGLLLQQQINLLRYRDAGVAVLAIAIVVSILDYTSAYIRERII
ncbi:MAG: phosphonate ABC transporter, permease protein PhnE [Anaerolineae bacterium]